MNLPFLALAAGVPIAAQLAKPDATGLIGERGTLSGDLSLGLLLGGAALLLVAPCQSCAEKAQSIALGGILGMIASGALRVRHEKQLQNPMNQDVMRRPA